MRVQGMLPVLARRPALRLTVHTGKTRLLHPWKSVRRGTAEPMGQHEEQGLSMASLGPSCTLAVSVIMAATGL